MSDFPSVFPLPEESNDPEGLLCGTRFIDLRLLLDAYAHGIFPWPCDEECILWFSPVMRGILNFSALHVPSRLKRFLKHCDFTFRIDSNFDQVIDACATVKRSEEGTWIIPAIQASYKELHRLGFAHSFETYNACGELVGGLYGVGMDRFFGGESMFFYETGASKFALLNMIATLKKIGLTWLDTQMVTPVIGSFGAVEISRKEFLTKLHSAIEGICPITTETLRANATVFSDSFFEPR